VPQEDYITVNIESFTLHEDESVYQQLWRTSFETDPPPNLSKNAIFRTPIAAKKYNASSTYGKYHTLTSPEDRAILQEIQTMFRTELEEFGYKVP